MLMPSMPAMMLVEIVSLEAGDAGIAIGKELALMLGASSGTTLLPFCFEPTERHEPPFK